MLYLCSIMKRSSQKYLYFSIAFLFIPLFLFQQGFTWQRFTTKDGLLSNDVYGVTQDKNGYIWVQNGNGFTRFDGVNLTSFVDKSNNLGLYGIHNLLPGENNKLYYNI